METRLFILTIINVEVGQENIQVIFARTGQAIIYSGGWTPNFITIYLINHMTT